MNPARNVVIIIAATLYMNTCCVLPALNMSLSEEVLIKLSQIPKPNPRALSFSAIQERARRFEADIKHGRPTKHNWTENLVRKNLTKFTKEEIAADFAAKSYPLIDEKFIPLALNFIDFKSEHGNDLERELYKDLTLVGLLDRLIKKVLTSFKIRLRHLLSVVCYVRGLYRLWARATLTR